MTYTFIALQKLTNLRRTVFFILALLPSTLLAQQWEIGGGIGGLNYKGDISPSFQPKFYRPGGNLFLRYNAGRAVSFKLNLLAGKIFADDSQSSDPLNIARARYFNTTITELSPQFEYNFLNYRNEKERQKWTPYVFAGIAVFNFDGQDNSSSNNNSNSFSAIQLSLPFGVGFKYVVGGNWNLGVEFGARKTFTDALDGLQGPIGVNKLQNGNPNSTDMYFYTGLLLSYTFYRVHCPDFY
ncbi:MAG: DUF6089 family protein [Bacteroidota bacterium]